MRKLFSGFIILTGLLFLAGACSTKHEINLSPVEVKPIHITIDVNVKIDRALDDFFSDIDKAEDKLSDKK
jgi:hypothetical protein